MNILLKQIQLLITMFKRTSLYNAGQVLKELLHRNETQIDKIEFVKANMNYYCSHRMISVVNQIGDQLLSNPLHDIELQYDNQPTNLYEDTLMPISNIQVAQQIINRNQNIKSASDHRSTERSHKNKKRGSQKNLPQVKASTNQEKQKQQKSHLLKLVQYVDNQDNQINQIRKQKQKQFRFYQRVAKNAEQKHTKEYREGVNFDYQGKVLELKVQKRNNLVSKVITPKFPQQIQQNKGKKHEKTNEEQRMRGTFLQTFQVKDKQQPSTNTKKGKIKQAIVQMARQQKPIIQFSKIKNLIQKIDVKNGVKATFNQNIIQKKETIISDEQLRKNKSNRKLSKNQYSRIKTSEIHTKLQSNNHLLENQQRLNNINIANIKELKDINKSKRQSRPLTSIKRRSITQVQNQKIKVQNINLKNFMIQKSRQQYTEKQERRVLDSRPSSQIKKQMLNRIDKHNLDYSRRKIIYQPTKKVGQMQPALPKMNLRQNQFPKARQKIRNGSALRRELTKKFQQSLRI